MLLTVLCCALSYVDDVETEMYESSAFCIWCPSVEMNMEI